MQGNLLSAWNGAKYHEHQERGIRWMLQIEAEGYTIPSAAASENMKAHIVRGGILGDKMGVGKTIQSMGLIMNGGLLKTLVITPLAVRGQWEHEFRRSNVNLYLPTQWGGRWILQDTHNDLQRPTVHLAHYDKVVNRPDLCEGEDYDRIILDEAHIIRNPSTKKAQTIFKIAEKIPYHWSLTGTPITNSMDDAVTYLKFIGCPVDPGNKKWQDKYGEWIRNLYMSRELSECEPSPELILPPIAIEETRLLDFTNVDEESVYRGIYANEESKWRCAQKLKGQAYQLALFSILLRLRQVSVNPQIYIKARKKEPFGWNGPEFHTVSRKFDEVAFLLKEANEKSGEHKWIVFCQFHEEMVLMEAFLRAHSFVGNILQYHGGMSMKQREATLNDSKLPTEKGKQDVFLIQLKAGSTGINLQHYDRIIFISPWWTPSEMEQAKARAVRIGQNKVVKVYLLHLRTEDVFNIDKCMMEKVFKKKTLADDFESWSVHKQNY